MSAFSKKIKYLRETMGFSTRQLSEHIGISCGQISKYENAKHDPSLKVLQAYVNFFKVSYDYLCDEKN